jgi:replicative DNA helicase
MVSVGPYVNVFDLETEFANHMRYHESVEYFIREGVDLALINSPKIKGIWTFVQEYFRESGKIPSTTVLKHEFSDFEFVEVDSTPSYVADRLKKRYEQNQIQDLVRELAGKTGDSEDAMKFLRSSFLDIERNTLSQRNIWRSGDSTEFLHNLKEKIVTGMYVGASFGWSKVDHFTGGLRPGQLGFLVARPKRKKTFCTLKAFIEQARDGWKPMLVTMENTDEEIMLRLSCMLSGYPWDQAQRGEIGPDDWELLKNAWSRFEDEAEFFIIAPEVGDRSVAALTIQADKLGARSMLLSQFSYLEGTKDYSNDWQSRSEIVLALKNAASRPDNPRPIFVEAQLNREKDVALTDAIKQRADIVFELEETLDMQATQETQLRVMESRNTGYGEWNFFSEFRKETRMDMVD